MRFPFAIAILCRALAVAILAFGFALTAQAPPPAAQVLQQARTKASAERKKVFLIFGASWCGWCKKLDAFIETPANKAIIEKYFVVAHLTIQEQDEKAVLNHPGAQEILAKLGGKDSSVPFFAFLDARSELVVNSMRPEAGKTGGSNIGHPVAPEEIDWFMTMLHRAVPAIKEAEAKVLKDWLVSRAKS
jgi:thiol-disulfide isomerase/thioredoxin